MFQHLVTIYQYFLLDLIRSLATIVGDSMNVVIFYQMLFSANELALFLFQIDAANAMSAYNFIPISGASTVLLPTFLFCKLSENMSAQLQTIGEAFYECSWYCLSARQQRGFLLPIQRAQKEVRMNGLDIVECSLENFSAVSVHSHRIR